MRESERKSNPKKRGLKMRELLLSTKIVEESRVTKRAKMMNAREPHTLRAIAKSKRRAQTKRKRVTTADSEESNKKQKVLEITDDSSDNDSE